MNHIHVRIWRRQPDGELTAHEHTCDTQTEALDIRRQEEHWGRGTMTYGCGGCEHGSGATIIPDRRPAPLSPVARPVGQPSGPVQGALDLF